MPYKRVLLVLVSITALGACGRGAANDKSSDVPRSKPVAYRCDDGSELSASFTKTIPMRADVKRGDDSWSLTLAPSGSGAKYSDGQTTFWTKGAEAVLETSGERTINCQSTPGRS